MPRKIVMHLECTRCGLGADVGIGELAPHLRDPVVHAGAITNPPHPDGWGLDCPGPMVGRWVQQGEGGA